MDYEEHLRLHIVEAFLRVAIFHFKKMDYLKEEAVKVVSNQTDFQFIHYLITTLVTKNYQEMIN